jgi:zinc/manganese transport system substrate-binding protein
MKIIIILFILSFCPEVSLASKLSVVTSSPDIAWAARAVGGEHVTVESLLEGSEDAHHVDIVPSFVQKVSKADLVCSTGLSLEIAWLPKVIARSNNKKILGQSCELGSSIEALEKPTGRVDRSMGDVHSDGNPHFTLGPSFMITALTVMERELATLRPELAAEFKMNRERTTQKIQTMLEELRARLEGQRERLRLMEYHREFSYFMHDYDLLSFGSLEEVPGAPPSAGRLAQRVNMAKENKVNLILASQSAPPRILNRFAELSGVEVITIATMMESEGSNSDYIAWQRSIIEKLLQKIADRDS